MLLQEIWKKYNEKFDVSDQGGVRFSLSGRPVPKLKTRTGYLFIRYDKKPSWKGMLFVHKMILTTFRPIHAKCMNFCDHINRKRDDNRLVNLRWSNVVLNGMNKKNVRGWLKRKTVYCPSCKVLDRHHRLDICDTPEEARKVYLNFQTRMFEVIEALMKRDIPVEIQRLILDYWLQRLRGRAGTPKRAAWLESNATLWSPKKGFVAEQKTIVD